MQFDNTFDSASLLGRLPATGFLLRVQGSALEPIFIGEGLEHLLGVAPAALPRNGWLRDRIHPRDAHLLVPEYQTLAAQPELARLFRVRGRDGEYRWIQQRCRLFQPGSPQDYLIAGLLSDGSEQQALEEAARRYQDFTRLSSDWYWEQDDQFRFTYFSREFQEITGVSAAGVIGKTRWAGLGAEDHAGIDWEGHKQTLLAHQSFRNFEYPSRSRPGRILWFRTSGQPKFDEDGNFSGYIGVASDITGYKTIEEELRHASTEQKAILENAPVGILFTKSRVIQRCNPRGAEMFGYDADELIGKPGITVYASQESYDGLGAEAAPLLGTGRPFETEIQLKRKTGELFWCHLYAKAVDPQQTDEATIWLVEDITERRQNEETLRETLLEMEAVMINASVGILFTKNRCITRYNRRFGEMFGFRGDQGLGMPGLTLYPSQAAYDRLGTQASPLLSAGKPFQAELEMRRQDDTTFWAQLIGYLLNPEDPAQGTIWIVEDRTEQKRSEESLRNAVLENEAILENAMIGIAVVEDGCILRCNRKMEEIFGYAAGDMNGVGIRDFYASEEEYDDARTSARNDLVEGRVHTREQVFVRQGGSAFWGRLSGRPLDPAQPLGRSLWLVDDITQRKQAEDELLRGRDQLEWRVQERTVELAGANAKLQAEIVERRQAEARVRHMAHHDSLTGLPNRSLLTDRLEQAMQMAQRSGHHVAIMFIDLDRFKTINDSLGHLAGDRVLKQVARRLLAAVRASDTVSRLGGDEFVVVLPDLPTPEESSMVVQKVFDVLAEPFPFEGRELHISPSIGVCIYPRDGQDAATLMRNADTAMYQAKASGRNNYQLFTREMNLAAAQYFELENSLRRALSHDELVLHFQPIVDVASRSLCSMEVLLRWRHPTLGILYPDRFIAIAEESGLIVPIGEWVMRKACEQNVEWQRRGLPVVPLAVNLSARQFLHRKLADSIDRMLAETGIDPSLLEIEVTETVLMQHGEQTLNTLARINALGIRLSIDDFGTGYSSLAYLKRFPVQKIKIDSAFIKDLDSNADDQAIVAAIVALSDRLQLSVVAEGVESERHLSHLRLSGCLYAQGFLFSPPVAAAQAERFLDGGPMQFNSPGAVRQLGTK